MLDTKTDETQYLLSSSATSAPAPAAVVVPVPAPTPAPVKKQANGSKKRTAASNASSAASQDSSQAKKPKIAKTAKVGDGQNAKSTKMTIPLDECCPLPSYEVHIGDDGTIWDASLNQTNSAANNNKFYKIQVFTSIGLFGIHDLTTTSYLRMQPSLSLKHSVVGVGSASLAKLVF